MSTAMMWMLMRDAVLDEDKPNELLEWACSKAQALVDGSHFSDKEAVQNVSKFINDENSDFNTKPIPRLFYYCEGHGAWMPLDNDIAGYEQFNADMKDGDVYDLRIKRLDMTEAQFVSMPDIS